MIKLILMILIGIIIAVFNGTIKKFVPPYSQELSTVFTTKLANRLLVDLNRHEIPGLQLAVINEDRLVQLTLGTTDYERRLPLTAQHLLRLGGISELYTATIIMKLVELEQLKLDATIETWFPALPQAELITIKNLLNHTSGIYNFATSLRLKIRTVLNRDRAWLPIELYNYILRGQPYAAPGATHSYSNSNYLLLGLIAEDITGKKFAELLNEWILQPHSLQNTYLLPTDQVPDRLITGYYRGILPWGLHKHLPTKKTWASLGYTAGGIAATAGETAQFLHRLFSYHILKKETIEKMSQINLCKSADLPEQNGYGLGIRRLVLENDILWGNIGNIPGFSGVAFYCKERNYYIAILGNISLQHTQLLSTIIQTIHEQDMLFGDKEQPNNLLMTG